MKIRAIALAAIAFLPLMAAPAKAQDIGSMVAGLAMGALTGGQFGGQRPYQQYPNYAGGYGGYGGGYGGYPNQGYGAYGGGYGGGYAPCRIVQVPMTDGWGNFRGYRQRRICQ